MVTLQTQILRVLRSPKFFIAILVLFAVESIWIAVSAAYPMVFDENTHFGLIQLHAAQLNPVFLHQPPHSEFAGAITRDPSYLYHYLMSFPYRLIVHVTDSQMAQIIFLRFINIAMFGTALVLFRKLLLKTKVSPAIIHVALLFFVLIPVVPLLAGQLNYDNLLMPVAAVALLLATSISSQITAKNTLPIAKILVLATVSMLGCLVQFAFLPIFAGIFLWLGWQVWRGVRRGQLKLSHDIKKQWTATSWQLRTALLVPTVLSAGLFTQMYGVNVVKYHNLTVRCDQVLSEQTCALNGPWQRNHEAFVNKNTVNGNPVLYGASWTYRMFIAMFYTSSGGASPNAWYLSINPLPVIFVTALLVFAFGVLLAIRYHRTLFQGYRYLGMLLFISVFYCASLFLRNYQDYVHLGEKVAINGRYLFPVVLPLMILVALAYRRLLADKHHLKVGLLMAVFVLFLQGGGALSYINSSNGSWYWQNTVVRRINEDAQFVVKPLIVFKNPLASFGSAEN